MYTHDDTCVECGLMWEHWELQVSMYDFFGHVKRGYVTSCWDIGSGRQTGS